MKNNYTSKSKLAKKWSLLGSVITMLIAGIIRSLTKHLGCVEVNTQHILWASFF